MLRAREYISAAPGQKIVFAADMVQALAGFDRDKSVVFSGRHYAAELESAGFRVWVGVEAEPAVETVEKMIAFLRETAPDKVIAVGGGSVLDAAKAAYLAYQTNWQLNELFGVNKWSSANPGRELKRMTAIPTTSGTGSEATPYSNIVDHSIGVKKLIVETVSVPSEAVIIPALTATMPQDLTRATGCDALAHLLEAFLNVGADSNHPLANQWAVKGIELIKKYLPVVLNDPGSTEGREAMALAAVLGGMCIRFKSTGLPHLCSFSWFGRIAHGDAVAVLLTEAWRYYLGNPAVCSRTMELADIFPGTTPDEVISSYRKFLDSIGMPGRLDAWQQIDMELLDRTARSGSQNRMKLELAPLPVPLDKSYEILKDILTKSYC